MLIQPRKKVGRPRKGVNLREPENFSKRTKICAKCDEKKVLKEFGSGHASYRKSIYCLVCSPKTSANYNFGGTVVARKERLDPDHKDMMPIMTDEMIKQDNETQPKNYNAFLSMIINSESVASNKGDN
tara:strand:+ start:10978 stop:11361 length:384 start_codon:yes stop_codon:yes gene_type:complete